MPLASRTGMVTYRIKDAYYIVTSVSQVYQTSTGVFNPSVFRVYAYKGKLPAVGMYLQCWGSTDNINWTYITYKVLTETLYYIDITVKAAYKYYIVRLYDHNPSTDIYNEPNFYASASVSVIKDGEPGAQGNPGAKMRMRTWASGTYYMRGVGTEEWYDVVEYEGRLYLCRVSHTSSSSNSPATDTGYWETAQNWTFIATKLLLAEKIKADMIDADGITAKNVNLTGKITATSGKIGGWTISGNDLICDSFDASIIVEVTGSGFMRINNSEEVMCYIRADRNTALQLATFGGNKNTTALHVLCNTTGYGKAIEAYGNVILNARPDEDVSIKGLKLNIRSVNSSQDINRNDDYLLCSGNITIKLPSPQSAEGKIYHILRRSGTLTLTCYYIESGVLKPFFFLDGRNDTSTQITTSNLHTYISNGMAWHEIEN
ncbi:hypothetical protein [uncultured Bacteroides sp.]|uniref:hypothetical protein n=1 Tax=uncultured Bacteroides sp. TaxID=162156 RepID=UPI002618D46D|nr:hypothetical protein [uncultured Bacteroides sp.]